MKTVNSLPCLKTIDSESARINIETNKSTTLLNSGDQACVKSQFDAEKTWIERFITVRHCIKFVASKLLPDKCYCGRWLHDHSNFNNTLPRVRAWRAELCTERVVCKSYGFVEFQGTGRIHKAPFCRISHDTSARILWQLFEKEWQLSRPQLIISVHGGLRDFNLQSKLKPVLRDGLCKAAETAGAWIITSGLNTGVSKEVGTSLKQLNSINKKICLIGIAPWGVLDQIDSLDFPGCSAKYFSRRGCTGTLNSRHSYFLLTDNGTIGRYGSDIVVRRSFERHLRSQNFSEKGKSQVPSVCLIIEGGHSVVRTILNYVTETPPVSVVVADGSGRAADIISFMHRYYDDSVPNGLHQRIREQLLVTIETVFSVTSLQAESIYSDICQIMNHREFIFIYRLGESSSFDLTILSALLASCSSSPADLFRMAMAWDRPDIAETKIFRTALKWDPQDLEDVMFEALTSDHVEFVKLLLNNISDMQEFLTITRLEQMYNVDSGSHNMLPLLAKSFLTISAQKRRITLTDVGYVIEKLMGGSYRSSYCRRRFKPFYRANSNCNDPVNKQSDVDSNKSVNVHFQHPFHELICWAILTGRHEMAVFFWSQGSEPLARGLMAANLYRTISEEAEKNDLDLDSAELFRNYASEFLDKSLSLLSECHLNDEDKARQLLTYELRQFSKQTCLSMAMSASAREFISHSACQVQLNDLWMGGLRIHKYSNLKVMMGILCMPSIFFLGFKSKKQLLHMPQTAEEHIAELSDYEGDSESSYSSDTSSDSDDGVDKMLDGSDGWKVRFKRNFRRRKSPPDLKSEMYALNNLQNGGIHEHSKIPPPIMPIPLPPLQPVEAQSIAADKPLSLRKKFYEFYNAPITKFWSHTIAFSIFLMLFNYMIIVRMPPYPDAVEFYIIACICSFFFEIIREVMFSEPLSLVTKFSVWLSDPFNRIDFLGCTVFLIALPLRFIEVTQEWGRVIYCLDIIFWYIKLLEIFSVNKYLGPFVQIIGKMLLDMLYFVVFMFLVLSCYGVTRQAIRHPNLDFEWKSVRDIYYHPYFMIYGEVYAGEIIPECGTSDTEPCNTGWWIEPFLMVVYLLVENILLVNLLIAVFNSTYNDVSSYTTQVWKFQRYYVIMHHETKPVVPPPFTAISYFFLLCRCICRRKIRRLHSYDRGLKLFLSGDEESELNEFEINCQASSFAKDAHNLRNSRDERIRLIDKRTGQAQTAMEEINEKLNSCRYSDQNMEQRMRRLEEIAENSLKTLHYLCETFADLSSHWRPSSTSPLLNIPGKPLKLSLDSSSLNRLRQRNLSQGSSGGWEDLENIRRLLEASGSGTATSFSRMPTLVRKEYTTITDYIDVSVLYENSPNSSLSSLIEDSDESRQEKAFESDDDLSNHISIVDEDL